MRPPRFSIARLMGLVAVAAGFSWLYRSVPIEAFVGLLVYGELIVGQAWAYRSSLRGRRRRAFQYFAISATAANLGFAALGVFYLGFGAMVQKSLMAVFALPIALGAGAAWAIEATRPEADRRRSPLLAWSAVIVLVALPASAIYSDWPLRLAFLASRPALDRLADRIEAGESLDRPEWAGLFRIAVRQGRGHAGTANIALTLEADSTGNTWLVRAASAPEPPSIPPQVLTSRKLSGDARWWLQEED